MPIELPDFKNSHCVAISVCGEVKTDDRNLIKLMRKEKEVFSAFKTFIGKTYIRIILGGKSGKHLHIDVAHPKTVNKELNPKTKLTVVQVQRQLEPFEGKEVEVGLRGLFETKLDELPENGMIQSLLFEMKMGKVGIKMKGAQFSIVGAPIETLSWQPISKNEIGVVLVSHRLKTVISEQYLTSGLDTLETAFNYFILGKTPNEPR